MLEEKFAREKREQQLFYARNHHSSEEQLLAENKSELNGPDVHQGTPPSHDDPLAY